MWHLISLANVVNFLFNIKRVTIYAKLYKKKKTTDICLVIKVVTEQTNINDTCLLFRSSVKIIPLFKMIQIHKYKIARITELNATYYTK